MPLSFRTKSTFKYTFIIITDTSTIVTPVFSNVWSSQIQMTGVLNRDGTDLQYANSTVVFNKVERSENLTLDKMK